MAINPALGQAAFDSQPVYYTDSKMAWEQRLALAYDEAVAHIRASMAPGTSINLADYELAADAAGTQMAGKSSGWTTALQTETDASAGDGIHFAGPEAKDYYLGHFAKASANLGAFLTGYAREQIVLGALSQADFDQACELRLRALSDVIHLGRTGALPAMLNPGDLASEGNIIVATPGIYTPDGQGASGLGGGPLIVGIVVVCFLIGAGIGVAMFMSAENAKQRRIALDICQDAVRRGNPQAPEICGEMRGLVEDMSAKAGLLDNLIPKDLQKQVAFYGALGVAGMLVINFLPDIARSLARTQEVYAEQKIQNLTAMREFG